MEDACCKPLCPIHFEVMAFDDSEATKPGNATTPEGRRYSCTMAACRINYSQELGYFALEENDDHWDATHSPSLRIQTLSNQAVCPEEHESLMYLESLDGNFENFRCPQKSCGRTIQVRRGGPPAYWGPLERGHFET